MNFVGKLAGAISAAMLIAPAALACTCAPADSAEAQAAKFNLVAVVETGESWELANEPAREEAEAKTAYYAGQVRVLKDYVAALLAGDDVAPLDDVLANYAASASYRPAPYPYPGQYATLMKVERVLKGEMARYVVVRTSDPGNPTCGVRYRPDTEILLLANGSDGVYSASMCSMPQYNVEDFDAALSGDQEAE